MTTKKKLESAIAQHEKQIAEFEAKISELQGKIAALATIAPESPSGDSLEAIEAAHAAAACCCAAAAIERQGYESAIEHFNKLLEDERSALQAAKKQLEMQQLLEASALAAEECWKAGEKVNELALQLEAALAALKEISDRHPGAVSYFPCWLPVVSQQGPRLVCGSREVDLFKAERQRAQQAAAELAISRQRQLEELSAAARQQQESDRATAEANRQRFEEARKADAGVGLKPFAWDLSPKWSK